MSDEEQPKRLPLRQQEAAPEPTKQEQVVRALAGLWSRRKAEKIVDRLMVNNLIDLRFCLKVDDPTPERIGWWIHKLAELFPGITPKLAINTYERLEALHCLRVNKQKKETKKPIHLPVRLTITQERVLREAIEDKHGFMKPSLSNSQTFSTLVSLGLARYSTAASQKGKPPYITPQGKYAIKVLDGFRTDTPDDYARAARADVNIMQLDEIREKRLPLGPVSPALDVSRPRGWEDAKKGPESPQAKAERMRKLHAGRDAARARKRAQAGSVDPFEDDEPSTTIDTPQAKKKKRGRPKGSKNKKSGLNKKTAAKKTTTKKTTKKAASKRTKKESAPGTPNTPTPAAKTATPPKDDPRRVRGQEGPQRIEGNAERKAAAQAALAALKAKRGESDPFDPFED